MKNQNLQVIAWNMQPSSGSIERLISDEFDGSASDFCCRYKQQGLSRSSLILMNWLVEEGLSHRNVLDLGCGAGSFSLEALKKGALSCVGIDLSPEMIKTANGLAREMGFQDRSKFEQSNAASADLPGSDVVVLDKVICCYPEPESLLSNAVSATLELFCFVVPRDEGLWKWPLRIAAKLDNLIRKVRGKMLPGFYLHPLEKIDRTLTHAGLRQERKASSRMWLAFLYRRPKNETHTFDL